MKILKWLGIVVGALLSLVIVVALGLFLRGRGKALSAPEVTLRSVAPLSDSAAVARGRHLADAIVACETCHAPGLSGRTFPTPAILLSMAAPNLTRGQGGVGAEYTVSDWDRAIRHGIGKDGRSLAIMPSEAYAHLSDADFAALVAYLQSLTPTDRAFPARRVGIVGGVLIGAGVFPLAPKLIEHDSVGARAGVAPGVNAEYGRYLADIGGCRTCHGPGLQGAKPAGGDAPPGPSLVAFAAGRSVDDFRRTIRTGRTPTGGGRALNPEFMPWPTYARMSDDELQAIWLYVQSLSTSTKTP
jgi:mono/diheme cytochrome c family protein